MLLDTEDILEMSDDDCVGRYNILLDVCTSKSIVLCQLKSRANSFISVIHVSAQKLQRHVHCLAVLDGYSLFSLLYSSRLILIYM